MNNDVNDIDNTITNHHTRGRRLARNTLYLYAQMAVQLMVSLFTTRVIYDVLGKTDYGIFSAVGGVMSVFVVFNSLEAATMRFITYEQEGGSPQRMHTVFSTARAMHLSIALLVLVLAETAGLYYVCNYLVIPPDRLTATIVIYQFTVLTAIIGIMCAPYDALIVAHERMGVFASIGIYNVLVNLVIVFLVKYADTDKLILYSALVMMVQISMRLIYGYYCKRSFPETRGKWIFDRVLFVDMLKFGGWSFNGTLASIGYTQGINLLFNYFFGPLLNAAYGVATVVQGKIYTFAENFLMAVKPQVVKSYVAGDKTYLHTLIVNSSRFSLLLLFLLSLPVILETHYILYVWLGDDIPDYTVAFVRLSLMMTMVDALGRVMCMAIHATGRIARFQMIEANMLLLIVPIAAFLLWRGYSPTIVFVAQLVMFILTQLVRMLIVCPAVGLSIWLYSRQVLLRSLLVVVVGSVVPVLVHCYGGLEEHPLTQVIVVTAVSLLSSSLTIYWLGCDDSQRMMLKAKVQKVIQTIKLPA